MNKCYYCEDGYYIVPCLQFDSRCNKCGTKYSTKIMSKKEETPTEEKKDLGTPHQSKEAGAVKELSLIASYHLYEALNTLQCIHRDLRNYHETGPQGKDHDKQLNLLESVKLEIDEAARFIAYSADCEKQYDELKKNV